MPSADSNSASAPLQELREQLASLATAAKSLREQRPSWLENILHPGRQARREADFGAAVVAALKKTMLSLEETQAGTSELERRLADLQGERLKSFQTDLNEVRERQEKIARAAQEWTDRVAEFHGQLGQLAREQKEKIDQIASDQSGKIDLTRNEQSEKLDKISRSLSEQSGRIDRLLSTQTDLGNELRERIQHVLDEQRVAIRQLSLKASEDAILSDRARRAAEQKMEELTQRIPPPPA
jgi:vacuolar-type H+-ATPase subunit I/STV1